MAHISLDKPEPEKLGEACPECGKELLIRTSRFGPFVACSGFPACRYKRSIPKLVGVPCPICREGQMVEKRSGRGKVFFSCDRYPACTFSVWNRPLPGACPQCGGLIMQGPRGEGAKCSQCAWAAKDVPPDNGQIPINQGPVVPAEAVEKPAARRTAAAGAGKTTTTRRTAAKPAASKSTASKTAPGKTTRKAPAKPAAKAPASGRRTAAASAPRATTKRVAAPRTQADAEFDEIFGGFEPTGS